MILAREQDRPAIEHVVKLQQSLEVDAKFIDREEIRELTPKADLNGIVTGCYEKKSGYADPRATVYALAHRAKEHGATEQRYNSSRRCAPSSVRAGR